MSDLPDLPDLRLATDQSRVDFLQTDLELCFTFADLAKTERGIGDLDAAHRLLEKAELGYVTMAGILPAVESAGQKIEIQEKLTELRGRLDREQQCLNGLK